MQMPPSNFFKGKRMVPANDEEEEDYSDEVPAESILELAESKADFSRECLLWHYRSRHQSLIAFSNLRYYREALIIPPAAAHSQKGLGIEWNYLAEGVFQKGLNIAEAGRITEELVTFINEMADVPAGDRKSIGVVVMNAAQAALIREQVDQLLLEDEEFAAAHERFHEEGFPPAFIRNLERVQGDERDVIVIGFTYGPDPENGKVARRFGPINGVAGSRRLNVLITRSRDSMRIFTSMTRDRILGGKAASGGVADLADFLAFAQNEGRLEEPGQPSGREPDSDFEVAVARVITTLGFEVDCQVGVSKFFIDLGVRRPGENRYLCGIECDGATYHSHPIARDRDRLRQEILEARGWTIHRIWSTDWFRNRGSEIERLRELLS
jgi:very-short-patch-repair endonuclease